MAEQPNVNPTPRQEFQTNKQFVTLHRDMMQQPMLGVSIQYALLHFQRGLCDQRSVDGNSAAQGFYKLQGVHEFLDILRKLAEMPAPPPPKSDPHKIDHKI